MSNSYQWSPVHCKAEVKGVRGRGLDHNMTSPVHSNTRVTEIGKSIHHTKSKLRLLRGGGGGKEGINAIFKGPIIINKIKLCLHVQ